MPRKGTPPKAKKSSPVLSRLEREQGYKPVTRQVARQMDRLLRKEMLYKSQRHAADRAIRDAKN